MYPSVENAGRGSRGRVNGGRVTLLSCGGSQPGFLAVCLYEVAEFEWPCAWVDALL